MKTEYDISNALTNTEHYMTKVKECAQAQLEYDLDHFDLGSDNGQKRMQHLVTLTELAQNVETKCKYMRTIIGRAMAFDTPRMLLEESEG